MSTDVHGDITDDYMSVDVYMSADVVMFTWVLVHTWFVWLDNNYLFIHLFVCEFYQDHRWNRYKKLTPS